MNPMFYILLILIIIGSLIAIFYMIGYNKMQSVQIRINEAETVIDDNLRQRFDIVNNLINILDNNFEMDNKFFKDFNKIKSAKISNFDLDRKITEAINIFKQIKFDNKGINEDKEIKIILKELRLVEEHLEAAKVFYNDYTSKMNKIIKVFPSNLIARFHHINVRPYFDGKDLTDDDINDFKL